MTGPDAIDGPYQLSCELSPAHQSDVKAVLAISNDLIASASRDSSVAVWRRDDSDAFQLAALLGGHNAYVNSLAYVPADEGCRDNLLASGGNSAQILLHNLDTLATESQKCLSGHGLNVCSLTYFSSQKRLMSGSWDCTARVWSRASGAWRTQLLLEGHYAAVWGVAIVDGGRHEGCYLTGSADQTINLWDPEGKVVITMKGSPEPVRSLAVLPDFMAFVSACNDDLLRVWKFDGEVTLRLVGHTDYVYQVVLAASGPDLLSCGEDYSARVWKDGTMIAALLHPCQTVWSVSPLPNGDVVTGGSDGRVRIWTADEARFAKAEEREAYGATVARAMRKPESSIVSGASDRTMSIDIDLSDEAPPIPLIYERGADPRHAAEVFGRGHQLSENYIDQIEAFIRVHRQSRGWLGSQEDQFR